MKIPFLKTATVNKTWVALGIALSIGVVAAIGARVYLSDQMAAIEARGKDRQISLVVAKRDLAKGERLDGDNVAVRHIPANYAQSTAVSPDDFDRLDGQRLAYPVRAGEMILWSLLEAKRPPTFSARLEAGRRAVTVPVDEINSISGMLEPGDLIDLLVTLTYKGKKITVPLLQRVQVMATGQRAVDDPKSGERREYSTVTLQASQEQASTLVVARDAGKITALLRNPKDAGIVPSAIDVNTLLGLTPPADAPVPVLYGGRGAKFAPEALVLGTARSPVLRSSSEDSASYLSVPAYPSPKAVDVASVSAVPVPGNSSEAQP